MKKMYHIVKIISPFMPKVIRKLVRSHINLINYDLEGRLMLNPYRNINENVFEKSKYTFGIIEDVAQEHKHYIAACEEMHVSYKVLKLLDNNWVDNFRLSGCDAFLVWPSDCSTIYKHTYDYRLNILENDLKKILYPTAKECWITEHKPRLRDWLDAYNIPHVKTWIFHNYDEANTFVKESPLPIVVKTATGASGSGVWIITSRKKLLNITKKAFRKGISPRTFDPRDLQRGFIYLQEYQTGFEEWRMVRIGNSFFGYRKEPGPSGMHSASHRWSWLDPGPELLNFLKDITDKCKFTSMDIDVFRTKDGNLLVSEFQTVFGCNTPAEQMKINNIEGRYVFENNTWLFEKGEYSKNHMCNLRIKYLIEILNQNL